MQLELFPRTISKKRMSTNLTARHHPVHRWFNFIAGFSPEFVTSCINEANLSKNGVLVDPFAGLSTALVQANFEGIRSIGFEPHPFFFDMSQAKIHPPYDCLAIDNIELKILKIPPYTADLTDIWSEDAIRFLKKLLQERELRLLAQALLAVLVVDGPWTRQTLNVMAEVFDYIAPISLVSDVVEVISAYIQEDRSKLRWLIDFAIHSANQ